MRKPSLTIDTFVAALAVLGMSASSGCSKAERAAPEPGTKTGTASPPTPAVTASAVTATPADAGSPDAKAAGHGGHASCGAGSCSADMKKGN